MIAPRPGALHLVLGGEDPVGREVALQLARRTRVRVLVDPGRWRQESARRVEVVPGSAADPAALALALREVDVLHHCLAPASPVGPVLAAATAAGVRRLVHLSSVAVLGPARGIPHPESARPRPGSRLGRACLAQEAALATSIRPETVILRAGVAVGPGPDAVLRPLLRRLARGLLLLPRSAERRGGFIAVSDLARAFLAAAERGRPGAAHVAVGFDASWSDFFRAAASALGRGHAVLVVPSLIARVTTPEAARLARPVLAEGAVSRRELVWSPRQAGFEEAMPDLFAAPPI